MKLNLFKKYFLTTAVIVILSLTFIMTTLSFFVSSFLAREKRSLLSENCRTISTIATEGMKTQDFLDNMSMIIRVLGRAIEANIFLADSGGNVFVCSCNDWIISGKCIHNESAISQRIISAAMKGEYYEVGTMDNKYNDVFYTIGIPLYDTVGNTIGAVFASSPASSLKSFLGNIFRMFLLSSAIPLILMFFSMYAITFRLTRPLRLMSDAARSMAKGDFSKRIPITSDDEIGELALAFNQMSNSLVQLEGMRRSFIANVSHELKTPMTTIGGFIDGIIDGTIEPDKHKYYLEIVSSEIKRLSRLVQSMLSLAKLESGEMKLNVTAFNISEVLFSIVVSQEQRIEAKNIDIRGLDRISEVIVNADKDLIHQVIYNLVDNALKFTNEGGYISFNIYTDNDGYVIFKIRNSGEGIPQKELPYIFERFYKTDKSRSAVKESTGLGLYIVKTIIDIHRGTITVRSMPGEYTEFEFKIPA